MLGWTPISSARTIKRLLLMFLIDTNVISEARKGRRADAGVQDFWSTAARGNTPLFLAAITIGELRRGVELIRHRGDQPQAKLLEQWLAEVLQTYGDRVLDLDGDAAQIWGRLRVPNPHNAIDKQIAAIALLHDLTVVTRNVDDFAGCGVRLLNPFQPAS
jgi:predicted nucleic acid-binding protein